MIGELAFKGFCTHAAAGLPIRGLFITPNKEARHVQQVGMVVIATELAIDDALYIRPEYKLKIGNAVAYQRIAHRRLDMELKGMEWHFIHGVEYVEALDDGDAIALNLMATARLK